MEGIDLKVLKHFQAEVAHLCEPGDLLYLRRAWPTEGWPSDMTA